jgi:hypothetical protein
MAASRFVKVTDKEISEIKINSVQRKHKDLMSKKMLKKLFAKGLRRGDYWRIFTSASSR